MNICMYLDAPGAPWAASAPHWGTERCAWRDLTGPLPAGWRPPAPARNPLPRPRLQTCKRMLQRNLAPAWAPPGAPPSSLAPAPGRPASHPGPAPCCPPHRPGRSSARPQPPVSAPDHQKDRPRGLHGVGPAPRRGGVLQWASQAKRAPGSPAPGNATRVVCASRRRAAANQVSGLSWAVLGATLPDEGSGFAGW